MSQEKFNLIPPTIEYMSTRYVLSLPVSDSHFKKPWDLRVYTAQLLEQRIGDQIQLTSLKVKKPGPITKAKARLRHEEPNARIYATIKF